MKTFQRICFIIVIFTFSSFSLHAQKAYFLHHSTGNGVFNEGKVANKINNYNTTHGKSYVLDHKYYPNTPYNWKNYPYDYWYLWINGNCNNSTQNTECLESMLNKYDIIVFKHCFPGADILEDIASPSVSSAVKCIANYKLQYRALRDKFDNYPNKHFVIWTLAPRHRLYIPAQSAARGLRARQFVNWVKNDWLTEDGESHPNIHIFDFYNIVAESDPNNPQVNRLKYAYEKSHTNSDSHPNTVANQVAGEEFANFIIGVFKKAESPNTDINNNNIKENISYNPLSHILSIQSIDKAKNKVTLFDTMGKKHLTTECIGNKKIDLSKLNAGLYIVKLTNNKQKVISEKILVKK